MPDNSPALRILIEPLGDHALNLGDVAMRQVAARRLRELWPNAEIAILTKDPEELARSLPGLVPLDVTAQRAWSHSAVPEALRSRLPNRLAARVDSAERVLRTRWPRLASTLIAAKRRLLRQPVGSASEFVDVVLESDLVFVSGAGAVNDHFGDRISGAFDLMSLAINHQIPTVMMGQGIGPLGEGPTAAAARRTLPRVDLIGLREDRTARPLLARLGVPERRLVTTGDDAVELAYDLRQPELGDALGLNVRRAGYVPLTPEDLRVIGDALARFLSGREIDVVPVPTSRHSGEADLEVAQLVATHAQVGLRDLGRLHSAEAAILRISACRVLVTGSYHAAVFALAQGIPAVCLAPNPYYVQKFAGLAELFGSGCFVVERRSAGDLSHLADFVSNAWETAADHREELLAAAVRQVDAGRAAYARIRELVEENR